MPFKSSKQRKYCFYQYNKALKQHKKPKWDCIKYESHKIGGRLSNKQLNLLAEEIAISLINNLGL